MGCTPGCNTPCMVFADLTLCGIALGVHRWYILLLLLPLQAKDALTVRKRLEEKFPQRYEAYRRATWF